jgi:hypothetical protein
MSEQVNPHRRGKIARLPAARRAVVNRMLRDGASYASVIEELKGEIPDLNASNVTNWQQGGYQEWLREQDRLEDMRIRREFALEVVRENKGSEIHEAGLQVAASQIYELLSDFDVNTLKEKLAGDPENYARIVNAIAKLSDGGLKYERYRAEVAAAKARIEAELKQGSREGGLTPEARERIERELKLL